MAETKIQELEKVASQVRRDILRMVHKVNSGHPGGSLGCTEFFIALYYEIMKLKDGFDMDSCNEDLFFLSKTKSEHKDKMFSQFFQVVKLCKESKPIIRDRCCSG